MTTLYKFIAGPDYIRSLLRGSVKFTPIPDLNDPSELSPVVVEDDVRKSLTRLRLEGYDNQEFADLRKQGHLLKRLAPECMKIPVPSSPEKATELIHSDFFDDIPRLKRMLYDTAQKISSRVGIFCLSERRDSLPMWAHYASNAKGLVVEFEDLDKIFPGDNTGVLWQPIPVYYEQDGMGITFEPRSHESLFFCKFTDWSYEREVRIVLPLDDCRQSNESTYTYNSSFGIQNDGKSLHHRYHSNSSRMVNTSNWRLRAKQIFTLSSNAVMRVSAQHPKASPSSSSVSEIIARNRCHSRPAKLNAFNRSCISARTSPMRALSHSNFA